MTTTLTSPIAGVLAGYANVLRQYQVVVTGDPAALAAEATRLIALADRLNAAAAAALEAARKANSGWRGPAYAAFLALVERWSTGLRITEEQQLRQQAEKLRGAATALRQARQEMDRVVAEFTERGRTVEMLAVSAAIYNGSLTPYLVHANAVGEAAVLAARKVVGRLGAALTSLFPPNGTAPPPVTQFNRLVDYITREMIYNGGSQTTQGLHRLNNPGWAGLLEPLDSARNKAHAYGLFTWLVQPRGVWDHKPEIVQRYGPGPANGFTTPLDVDNGRIRHDFWSNLHFGYVGTLAGFGPNMLHFGANAADWAHLRAADPADQYAIQLGIDLAHRYRPDQLTPDLVRQYITDPAHLNELRQRGAIRQ